MTARCFSGRCGEPYCNVNALSTSLGIGGRSIIQLLHSVVTVELSVTPQLRMKKTYSSQSFRKRLYSSQSFSRKTKRLTRVRLFRPYLPLFLPRYGKLQPPSGWQARLSYLIIAGSSSKRVRHFCSATGIPFILGFCVLGF